MTEGAVLAVLVSPWDAFSCLSVAQGEMTSSRELLHMGKNYFLIGVTLTSIPVLDTNIKHKTSICWGNDDLIYKGMTLHRSLSKYNCVIFFLFFLVMGTLQS